MSKNFTKRISKTGVLGQEGVNLIERIVLEMGSRWTPSGPNETGIDGYIEFYDPVDQKALGVTVAVQSKAVTEFENNSASGGPTGARTEIRTSPGWAIFLGATHQTRATGETTPKSAFP